MAIIEDLLADFETPSGRHYSVEYNANGYIHLHTEHVRIDLTPTEFAELVAVVSEAESRLKEKKDDLEA